MKERKFLRSLALLVAIVLTVTTTFSNYNFVKAAETTTDAQVDKELVQCDDDWVIFKYTDEDGKPQFDVKYQGKTPKELKQMGLQFQYFIIIDGDPMPFYTNTWINIEDKDKTKLDFSKNRYKVRFRVVKVTSDKTTILCTSDAFALEDNSDLSAYVSNINIDYFYDLTKNPNEFKLELKVNKCLEQMDDLSISVLYKTYGFIDAVDNVDNLDNILSSTKISNISCKNYSNTYDIEGKIYTSNYSIISCDVEMPSSLKDPSLFDPRDGKSYVVMIGYNLLFDGFNLPIDDFLFLISIPTFDDNTLVKSVSINEASSNIKVGDSINLITNVLPENATNRNLDWSSSNEKIATVDQSGKITAKKEGTVTITASSTDGSNVNSSIVLTILPKEVPVKSIKITSPAPSVKAGKTLDLKANINSDATNKSLVWSSSNTKYATVDQNGKVTTMPAGAGKTVTITAKATDGSNVSATFNLKINKVFVNKVKLKAKKSVKVGKKLKIKLTINSDATNKAVKWSVNNKKYAKINSKGVLTAKKAGKGKTVKVTAKAKDGSGKKATIKIKIKK